MDGILGIEGRPVLHEEEKAYWSHTMEDIYSLANGGEVVLGEGIFHFTSLLSPTS